MNEWGICRIEYEYGRLIVWTENCNTQERKCMVVGADTDGELLFFKGGINE